MIATAGQDTATVQAIIGQALDQAHAWGHSAFIHLRLPENQRAKPIIKAWNAALVQAKVNYIPRLSGSRSYLDSRGKSRTEITEILYEIWPRDEDWELRPVPPNPSNPNSP
ncbi:MAG TPA: hypothetical protein VNL71_22645 [Chloroflexota bacterium]|nr:hypothetical protein [Chloroflexota bacterium]